MRQLVLLFLIIHFITVSGQKMSATYSPAQYKGNCSASFAKTKVEGGNNADAISKWIIGTFDNLKDPRCSLLLNYVNQSLAAKHYSFTQLFIGVPVYQSEIKVNIDNQNVVHSVFDNSYDTKTWNVDVSATAKPIAGVEYVIAIDATTGQPVLAQKSLINHSLETVTANGNLIFQQDMNCYFLPTDSLVSGKVFNPDPLTTVQQIYDTNGLYVDHGDTDAPWLDAQEQVHTFYAYFDSGQFSLQSPFVLLTNFDTGAPDVPPVTSTTGQFYYNRSESGFQDVNAFYHISAYHNYVHGLGFNCADSLVYIDTHSMMADNSFFTYSYYPCRIYYGVGGVPDAEDADVVVHEYCHFLSFTAAPFSNQGFERRGLDEGFCDYNAASYSKNISTFYDQWVYNWDGHNQYWPGRVVNSTKVYPADMDESIYDNGEIWSAALFALNGDLGRGLMDSLIIQTHYSYAMNIAMSDAAQLLIDADSLLYNGRHSCFIYNRLLEHELVSQLPAGCASVSGINQVNADNFQFLQQGNSFTLITNDDSKVTLQILSITGNLVAPPINMQQAIFNYQNPTLAAGIYLVNVVGNEGSAVFKWVKAVGN